MFSANTTQVSTAANYIEDVFSTWLYTGNGSTQTITNGIDLAGQGGLVWIKRRDAAGNNNLSDTNRPGSSANAKTLFSNSTNAESTGGFVDYVSYNSNGFNANLVSGGGAITSNGWTFASWTFREQPKFFDIVTYTGTGANRTIAHNLGSVPGCIFVKRTDAAADWQVYHRSLANTQYMVLNSTAAAATGATRWNSTTPTSTVFSVGTDTTVNASGGTYVAYIFAHDAGGFGNAGTDNVISCGGYTGNGSTSGPSVTLGYEPQWLMVKRASGGTGNWYIWDNMRGFPVGGNDAILFLNLTNLETTTVNYIDTKSTGFIIKDDNSGVNNVDDSYIYIAIRRGPMKTPTVGTSVYTSASRTGTAGVMPRWVAGFPVDWAIRKSDVTAGGGDWQAGDRLRGAVQVKPNLTEAETAASPLYIFDGMTGYSTLGAAGSDSGDRSWMFRRAPGFFDVVCYTGTGAVNTLNHNLGAVPELWIIKRRDGITDWIVGGGALGTATDKYLSLNSNIATQTFSNAWLAPTATTFGIGSGIPASTAFNASGGTYVSYLFASCPGVSKVGSYTGTAALQTVNCGFTSGARFVLIKRTDSTGDWYVWDSARGITAGNDPYLLLNSSAAEVTGTDYVDTDSTGFKVTAAAPAGLNASGGTYIFLAVS